MLKLSVLTQRKPYHSQMKFWLYTWEISNSCFRDISESQSYLSIPPVILVQALFTSWNYGKSFQRVSAWNIPSAPNHLPLCCPSPLLKIQFNCITLLLETLCWHPQLSNKVYFPCGAYKTVHNLVPTDNLATCLSIFSSFPVPISTLTLKAKLPFKIPTL